MALPKDYHNYGRLKVVNGNHQNNEVTILYGYYDYTEKNNHTIPNNEFKILYYIDELVNDDSILLICSGYNNLSNKFIGPYMYLSSTLNNTDWCFNERIILMDIPNGSTVNLNFLVEKPNGHIVYRYHDCEFASLSGYNNNCTIIVNDNALCGEHVFINLPESTKIIKNAKPQELDDVSKCAYDAAEMINKSIDPYTTDRLNNLKQVLKYNKKPYWYKIHRITIDGTIVGIHGDDSILKKQTQTNKLKENYDEISGDTLSLIYFGIILLGIYVIVCALV